ncbi:hypothetical protein TGAM01_v211092 [Trichoderma gamsii]|uniref:Uncharacterized protein n=1 Tax=Trichoderma gamsii TaxID=398673 RepID=A0A2P4Z6Y2_9HYPO|nr:hypothetical protein TGAM01_v211092 [Trichoderma gamsii]PON20048.1 hypothetical protein TGAM01_v211092 [Trichoderma gamsii]
MAPGQKLPAWYCRLVALTIEKKRDVRPEDFDEDLSDIDATPKYNGVGNNPSELNCDCDGEDTECDCQSSNDSEHSSERSYNGSDADYYYELKHEREERKQQLRDMEVEEKEEKERLRESESVKEEEVQAAYKSLQQAEIRGSLLCPLDSIASKTFRLYSLDYFDYRYDPVYYPSKYVEFYYIEEGDSTCTYKQPPTEETKIQGHLYLNVDCGCDFALFSPPKQAGLKKYSLKDVDGNFAPIFQFISNDHLIVTVSRDLVFMDVPVPPLAPDMFTFHGVRYDYKEEKRRRDEERKPQRSPSPRETWFEMSHPMGTWNIGAL